MQPLPSSQLSAAPPWQPPFLHTSPVVHGFRSSQAAAVALCWQPLCALQPSDVQGLSSLQSMPAPDVHTVFWQPSPDVHALPSEHIAALGECPQPVKLSQESSVHGLPSSHPSAAPGTQPPSLQPSPIVHASPSVQPPAAGACWQPP